MTAPVEQGARAFATDREVADGAFVREKSASAKPSTTASTPAGLPAASRSTSAPSWRFSRASVGWRTCSASGLYLAGDRMTEADWRLFPTLVRFDEVYHVHFRCNRRRILDHPNLWAYARELYQRPGVTETVAMPQIKRHYYTTHDELNPKRIIPLGPGADWSARPDHPAAVPAAAGSTRG
jgi:hypothetical protein